MPAMDANSLRRAFTDFFVERGHTSVPSLGLIPNHPTAPMFTNAGMNQFVPYFLGEERAPYKRATSIQKAVRLSGKHNDVDEVGKTRRHHTFFEMLGNFSFGDYFKEDAIRFAWELLTEVVGFDGDRLWPTVHISDDDAADIWRDTIGVPAERIQRLDKDNFWEMGETGPCGPCSEIHYDTGPEWGEEGGPAFGASDRYIEFWNLVFMQNFRHLDETLTDLPEKNIDTGGGLERWLMLLQGTPTTFETDVFVPILETVQSLSGQTYDPKGGELTFAQRLIADHARTMTFLISDAVAPSNEGRGYVLRGVIRRAIRRGYQIGIEKQMLAPLIDTVVEVMGDAYPELVQKRDSIKEVVDLEESRFRQTLRAGTVLLEQELETGRISGDVAFKLHDTYGFPIEITAEVAEERHVPLDREGFDQRMEEQRTRARERQKKTVVTAEGIEAYRQILDEFGATEFLGYQGEESEAEIVAVLPAARGDDGEELYEVFLDRSPFYAEGGGQVGDIGQIRTSTGMFEVIDTTPALPGLNRHVAKLVEGDLPSTGDEAYAAIDHHRREHIRRNHTGTHLLHATLREMLGQHVHQQGSYVGPDRLRFDINHHQPITPEELERVEMIVNERVLTNEVVRAYETTMQAAKEMGALMFFGDKYGEVVRVVEAGSHSVELCGGTHVHALGTIGPLKIISEGSIGSNMRRVEAVTGTASLKMVNDDERTLQRAAQMLRTTPDEVVESIERLLQREKDLRDQIKGFQREMARGEARQLVAQAVDGYVVARRDGIPPDDLRELAIAIRNEPEIKAVVLVGSPDGERVALVSAVEKGTGLVAGQLIADAAKLTGGGGNPKAPDIGVAGGKDASKIDDAIRAVREKLGIS
ncbi:MAG TPA: alanine--tRNA ligase [Acidimicrobiales bacterium]|jgi:alanyl-tRNA synthetase|nr:alanine--tRNA ligase [Acidimicrobiales bacterium]